MDSNLSSRLEGEKSAKTFRVRLSIVVLFYEAVFRRSFSQDKQSFVELNSGCICYAVSPTSKQIHIDLWASVPLMAILCFTGKVASRGLKSKKSDTRHNDVTRGAPNIFLAAEIRCSLWQRID